MAESRELEVVFRCPPEIETILPKPFPAVLGLPDWFKKMPIVAHSESLGIDDPTVKKCPPFIDAMTCGYLIPLPTDLHVKNGCFSWDWNVPGWPLERFVRGPISFHDRNQVIGTPFFREDRFIIKFINFWTIEVPSGYSTLITHPISRFDLPFLTLTGLVDADRYNETFINFPAAWIDDAFEGVLEQGTPIAQCIPVVRATWKTRCEPLSEEGVKRHMQLCKKLDKQRDVYRRQFRAKKR